MAKLTKKLKKAALKGISKDEALSVLVDTITFEKKHQDYDRVVELAVLYNQLITGKDVKDLLSMFVRRESPIMFEQRKALTIAITPSVAHRVMQTWYKVPRVEPVINKLDYEGEGAEEKKQELQAIINTYYGEESVDSYLGRRIPDLNGTDPNSFILTLFDNFDSKVEKARPYPKEVSSSEVINFEYKNNELLWLITCFPHAYLKKSQPDNAPGLEKKQSEYLPGKEYFIYNFNDEIRFRQVDSDLYPEVKIQILTDVIDADNSGQYYRIDKSRLFRVDFFEPKAGMVPAFRVGVKKDLTTRGRTCVNLFHAALPYFMKTIKTVSEMDLTMALHAFLQKLNYVPRCKGTQQQPCNGGMLPDGKTKCSICNGTGKIVISSTQDDIELTIPKDLEQIIDLSKLIHYVDLPIDTPKFQDEYIDKLEAKVIKTLYGSDLHVKDSVAVTATSKNIDMQAVYDALWPLAVGYAEQRKKTIQLLASFTDLAAGLIQEYKFAKDFKFKDLETMLNELKQAADSSAPAFIKQEIVRDISHIIYADRPDELRKLEVLQRFDPFEGKTETEIQYIISNNLASEFTKVLYAEFKTIFQELEDEQEASSKGMELVSFYDLAPGIQKTKVDTKVQDYIKKLSDQQAKAMPPGFDFGAGSGSQQ